MCNTFLYEAQPGLVVFEEIFSVTEKTYDRSGCCLAVFYLRNQHFLVHFCKLVIDVADHLAIEGSVLVPAYTTGLLNACMPCRLAYLASDQHMLEFRQQSADHSAAVEGRVYV